MKRICAFLVLAAFLLLAVSGCKGNQSSEVEQPVMSEETNESGNLESWEEDSKTKEEVVKYVKEVTMPNGKYYIPPEDRIAVFDMDGTIIPEEKYNTKFLFLVHYIQNDLKDNKELNETLSKLLLDLDQTPEPEETSELYSTVINEVLPGMSQEDYVAAVKKFMKTEREDFDGLDYEESMYQPMVELIFYLKENSFQIYVVSGTDRGCVWGCLEDRLKLERSHMIGSDIALFPSGAVGDADSSYFWQEQDELIRGNQYDISDSYNNKVYNIYRQIGKKPVFAAGNSDNDFSMLNYAKSNSYKSLSILLKHDDDKREYAYNQYSEWDRIAEQNGWIVTSMKEEFKNMFEISTVKLSN